MASGSGNGCNRLWRPPATITPPQHYPRLDLEAGSSSSSPRSSNMSQSANQLVSSSSLAAAHPLDASDPKRLAHPAGANLAPLCVAPAPTPKSPPSPTPFVMKTYELVDDPSTDDVISWSNEGKSFVAWSPEHLCRQLLPRYFKHSNFSSFVRQLNTYGFRKISLERWEFANIDFQRGQKYLLGAIHRRRASGAVQPPGMPLFAEDYSLALTMFPSDGVIETGNSEVGDEIGRLKKDKILLMKEIESLRQEVGSTMGDLRTMWEKLQTAEACQNHMIAFIHMTMNNPAFLAQRRQQSSTGLGSTSRGLKDCDELTSSGAAEHLYDTLRSGSLISNDTVNPHRQQNANVRGGVEAKTSTQTKPNWDEVRLVDSPLKTLDELVQDAKLTRCASMNKNSFTHPYRGSFTVAQDGGSLPCTLQQGNRSSGVVGGAAAMSTSWVSVVSPTFREQLVAPPSDQHCIQTTSVSQAACEVGVDGRCSWRSSVPGMLQADLLNARTMPNECSATPALTPPGKQSTRDVAADGLSSHQHPNNLMAADTDSQFIGADNYATCGAAINLFNNVAVNPPGWLENPLVGSLETLTPRQEEERCPSVHEEAQPATGFQKDN